MAVDQNGDLAGFHGGVFVIQTAFRRLVDQGGDFVGAVFGCAATEGFFVGVGFAAVVQPADFQCRLRRGEAACLARGGNGRVADVFEDEGAFFLLEQAADVVDEQAVAAVVVREGVVDGGVGGGLEVGVDVRAAKAVNRLFGVADEEERVAVGGKGTAEDFVLQRVGVLEFVYQGNAPVLRDGFGEFVLVRSGGEGVVNVEQQVVGAAFLPRRPLFGGGAADVLQAVELQGDKCLLFGIEQGGCRGSDFVEEGQCGQVGFGGGLAFFDGSGQVVGGKNAFPVGVAQVCFQPFCGHRRLLQQFFQFGQFGFVGGFAEFITVQHGVHPPEQVFQFGETLLQFRPDRLRPLRFGGQIGLRPSEKQVGAAQVAGKLLQYLVGREVGMKGEAGVLRVVRHVLPPEILRVGV